MKRQSVTLFILLLLPSGTAAVTLEEIQAHIENVRARIEILRAELLHVPAPAIQNASSTIQIPPQNPQFRHLPCISLARTLQRGSHGEDVQVLQRFLIKAGLLAQGNVTGYFGFLSEEAVGKWQIAEGLILTNKDSGFGIVGPQTRRSIFASCSQKTSELSLEQAQCALTSTPPATLCAGTWEKVADSRNCPGIYQCVASSTTSNNTAATSTPAIATTSDQTFQIPDDPYSKLLQEISASGTSSQYNSLLSTSTMMCVHGGKQFPDGTTLSVACEAGHCAGSTSGYITGICTKGLWCIPLTTYCAASLSSIDVNAYQGGGATPIGTGGSLNCPQAGWRAYLDCSVLPACRTGWNICTGAGWVYDPDQSVH